MKETKEEEFAGTHTHQIHPSLEFKIDELQHGYSIASYDAPVALVDLVLFFIHRVVSKVQMNCFMCKTEPCLWAQHKDNMERMFSNNVSISFNNPNQCRRVCYGAMFLIVNDGPTGRGVRKKLPHCIVCGIRRGYPSLDGTYMGFRER